MWLISLIRLCLRWHHFCPDPSGFLVMSVAFSIEAKTDSTIVSLAPQRHWVMKTVTHFFLLFFCSQQFFQGHCKDKKGHFVPASRMIQDCWETYQRIGHGRKIDYETGERAGDARSEITLGLFDCFWLCSTWRPKSKQIWSWP